MKVHFILHTLLFYLVISQALACGESGDGDIWHEWQTVANDDYDAEGQ